MNEPNIPLMKKEKFSANITSIAHVIEEKGEMRKLNHRQQCPSELPRAPSLLVQAVVSLTPPPHQLLHLVLAKGPAMHRAPACRTGAPGAVHRRKRGSQPARLRPS